MEGLGLAEKISLKVGESGFSGDVELGAGLHFFGEHFGAAVLFDDLGGLGRQGKREVDFYEVGERNERRAGIVGSEVVKRDPITFFLEANAGGNHQFVGGDGFKDFDDGLGGRQQRDVVLEQNVTGTVDESAVAAAEKIDAGEQRRA